MSWEVPEGRHYLAGPPRWWYWERWGSRAGEAGQTKLTQGNYMSKYETGYGAATATASYGGLESSHGGRPGVSVENVSKVYGRLRAVDGLPLDLRAGETVALLGPNGAGKSAS